MTALANRRSIMTLYADAADPLGHSVRLVLTEKDINVEVNFIDEESKPDDLNDLNPYSSLLTLIDLHRFRSSNGPNIWTEVCPEIEALTHSISRQVTHPLFNGTETRS